MQVQIYEPGRRLVVLLVEGASVKESLVELRRTHEVDRLEARGTGRVDGVRLASTEAAHAGVVDVISLTATLDRAATTLALVGVDTRGALLAGPLTDARAVDLSLSIELLNLHEAEEKEAPPVKLKSSSLSPTWAEVAARSAKAAEPEEAAEPDVVLPSPGDRIEHASFGLCNVEKLDDDEEFVLVRSAQGRMLRLSLDVLRLELVGEVDGKRQFAARARGGTKSK